MVRVASAVHKQRVDREVDDEPEAAHHPEADQLQPVGGAAHAVQQPHVRTRVGTLGGAAGTYVHGSFLGGHTPRVPKQHPERPCLALILRAERGQGKQR